MTTADLVIHNLPMQAIPPDWPGGYWWHWLVFTVGIIAFVLIMVMGAIWIERRGMARMQSRLGPNRAGPLGLLQPVAGFFMDRFDITSVFNVIALSAVALSALALLLMKKVSLPRAA